MIRFQGLPEVGDQDALREHVSSQGCFDAQENSRIYAKWFARAPRRLFREAERRYHLTDGAVCDVGCGYGMNLVFCRPGSYGIEIDPAQAAFGRSIGLDVREVDFATEDTTELPKVDSVWCSAVLEHVEAPHEFLRRLHGLLRPSGQLFLYVPTIPLLPALRHLPLLGRYFSGFAAADHVNAFVPATVRFAVERAGFEVISAGSWLPRPLSVLEVAPLIARFVDGAVVVARPIIDWTYPAKGIRRQRSG